MSTHVKNLMSLLFQLSKACARVEDEDDKAILFYILPSSFSNVVFTLSQMSS